MERLRATNQLVQPSSVTQVIADSVNALVARPAVLLIPILLDLYYVAGWKVTLQSPLERLSDKIRGASWTGHDRIAGWVSDAGGLDIMGAFWLLIPSLLGGADRGGVYDPLERGDVSVGNVAVAAITMVFAILAAVLVYGLFGAWLADIGLNRSRSWNERLRVVPRASARVLGIYGMGIGIIVLLCLPMLLAWGATAVAGIDLQGLFLPLIAMFVIGVVVLFFFAPEAVFIVEARPAEAMRLSARVVRRNGWTTLAFIAATTVISWGLTEVWERLATNAPGLMLAILASAFVGCALALAAMKFFYERWLSLEQEKSATASRSDATRAG